MEFKYFNVFLPDFVHELVDLIGDENIFKLVFDEVSFERKYISPFRKDDSRAGCFFWEAPDSKIFFVDLADTDKTHYDVAAFLQKYFDLKDMNEVAKFIKDKFKHLSSKDFKNIQRDKSVSQLTPKERVGSSIRIYSRDWSEEDRIFWSKYGITKQQLIDDKVVPLKFSQLIKGNDFITYKPYRVSYAYTDFPEERVKIYNVYDKNTKWVTNCTKDDIGNINNIEDTGDVLIIAKSYKDCRVLRNLGYTNVVWTQNEGVIPSISILMNLCTRFKKIVILFDNDEPGKKQGKRFSEFINSLFPDKSCDIYLPSPQKDPSDYYKSYGETALSKIIKKIVRKCLEK